MRRTQISVLEATHLHCTIVPKFFLNKWFVVLILYRVQHLMLKLIAPKYQTLKEFVKTTNYR